MIFSYNWLQIFFSKKLPSPQKLCELLTMHIFEIDGLCKKKDDWLIDIDVLPNRMPDSASHWGIAREISAILDYKLQFDIERVVEGKFLAQKFLKVRVKDKELCPRYCARIINNIKVKPSPGWLKEKLLSCGLQSINNIVDATNYVMLEMGQPLHAFDADKLEGNKGVKEIVVRRANKGEKISTLDGKNYKLDKDILVIADSKKPIAIAGIKGGKTAEVDLQTKKVILESANFSRANIYKTSKKINLITDASIRFSASLDPNLADEALDRVVTLIKQIAGGDIYKGLIDVYSKRSLSKKIILDLNYLNNLTGLFFAKPQILEILKRLKIEGKIQGTKIYINVPTFRMDLNIAEDIVEEIIRIVSYEKIDLNFPKVQTVLPIKNNQLAVIKDSRQLVKGLGFIETYNYSFLSEADKDFFRMPNLKEIENPLSTNAKYLRFSLIPNLLKVIKKNQKVFGELKLFEVGNVFNVKERRMLAGVMSGKNKFYELKGLVVAILQDLLVQREISFEPAKEYNNIGQISKILEIIVDGKKIGHMGEVSKETIKFYSIDNPVFFFEMDADLLTSIKKEKFYINPSKYPKMIRDLSVVVPVDTFVNEIIYKIKSVDDKFLRDIEIFDIYQGESLPKNKKNISFHITYQSKNKTLISKEVDGIQNKIIKLINSNFGWQVRS
jgi:phenylalanyl-tRNA synthetase beta chain